MSNQHPESAALLEDDGKAFAIPGRTARVRNKHPALNHNLLIKRRVAFCPPLRRRHLWKRGSAFVLSQSPCEDRRMVEFQWRTHWGSPFIHRNLSINSIVIQAGAA